VTSRSGLILALYGRPHSSECAVSEHRAIIEALAGDDPEPAATLMDRHLEAVAGRALIETEVKKRRDLREVLDAYAPGPQSGSRRAGRRATRAKR